MAAISWFCPHCYTLGQGLLPPLHNPTSSAWSCVGPMQRAAILRRANDAMRKAFGCSWKEYVRTHAS